MFRCLFKQAAFRRGIHLAAAAVTFEEMKVYTDKELLKKPKWYSNTVLRLENVLKQLSRYQPIESASFLHEAIDILKRVDDVNNTELSWRLGRAFVEEAEWIASNTNTIARKIGLLEEGIGHLKKALNNPTSATNAGPHKWYAIALKKLSEVDKKNKIVQKANNEIVTHFEQAAKIDPNDPFVFAQLALYYYEQKNYKMAINNAKAAEKIKHNFSNLNLFALGASLYSSGQKEDGIKVLKSAVCIKPVNIHDNKTWFKAKIFLQSVVKLPATELNALTWEY